jgi:HK97 family phage portal protein
VTPIGPKKGADLANATKTGRSPLQALINWWRGPGPVLRRDAGSDWLSGGEPYFSVPSGSGIAINQATAMSCAAVMACVSILSEDVAKLTPRLRRRKPKGGWENVTDHPLSALLLNPNDWQTWDEFCGQMMLGLCLRGNAYAPILRDHFGRPTALVPINPDQVTLWPAPDGSLFYNVARANIHEQAVLRDVPFLIPARDMLHIKGLSANGLQGLSKISMNREAIGLALAQEQQAARWMRNAAKPSGILSTDTQLTEEARKASKASWQEANSGLANSGKTAILEMGLKWQPLSMTSADIEFIASRTFQLNEIARMFRMPPHMIGEVQRVTTNVITQMSQDYFNNTLSTYTSGWQRRIEKTFDLPQDGIIMDFDRTILLEGDIAARFEVYKTGLNGIFTPNEIRDREGMDPYDETAAKGPGDKIYMAVNYGPLGAQLDLAKALKGNGPGSDLGGDNPGAGRPESRAARVRGVTQLRKYFRRSAL